MNHAHVVVARNTKSAADNDRFYNGALMTPHCLSSLHSHLPQFTRPKFCTVLTPARPSEI
jgi:hypothetical protein